MINTMDPSVAFLIKDRNKQSYSVSVPNKGPHGEIIAGAKFHYQKFGNKNDIWANGPPLSEIVIALFVSKSDLDQGIIISFKAEYFINKRLLKEPPRFAWVLGGWGPCSQTCGRGKRQKTVACFDTHKNKIVPRKFCSLIIKPYLESEPCNAYSCNFYWVAGLWEPCSRTCGSFGVQFREVYCVPQSIGSVTFDSSSITNISDPWNYMVSPSKCGGMPPVTARPCNRIPCPVDWNYSEWSQCSTSCGTGFATRQPRCLAPEGELFYSCGPPAPPQRRTCKGIHTRNTNHLCKHKRKRKPCLGDMSHHCSIPILGKYCKFSGFRRVCCETCSKNQLSHIIQ
ncbi:hypothetical protein AMK59_3927 [Oryctes borbonicus]|uniref:PLAC domain-containing protein n=1 Tax=Oryctes borbonicus TaxID=1629725 RepID=A0A0T6B4T5_9SCAR|nr:hypothetical protein AMK59_3927 [Oryctes borbonicus]